MKIIRFVRVVGVVALALFVVFGVAWRAKLSDSGLAAYQAGIKPAQVSVSIAEQGRIVKVEGVQTSNQVSRPCAATLIFDAPQQ